MDKVDEMFSVMYRLVRKNTNLIFVTADNGFPNFNAFKKVFSDRFFNFGISEGNMMLFAAGMASCEKVVYTFAIASFLVMRGYEFIRNDICIPNREVKMIGINSGLSCSKLGNTHYSIEDISVLSVLPNISILCPCCSSEMLKMLSLAKEIKGPVYIKYNGELYNDKLPQYDISSMKAHKLKDGGKVCLFSSGDLIYEVYEAAESLKLENIEVSVFYFPIIKPIDTEMILEVSKKYETIITVEEHSVTGGFGSIVLDVLNEYDIREIKMKKIGIVDYCLDDKYGEWAEMRDKKGLSARRISEQVKEVLAMK